MLLLSRRSSNLCRLSVLEPALQDGTVVQTRTVTLPGIKNCRLARLDLFEPVHEPLELGIHCIRDGGPC